MAAPLSHPSACPSPLNMMLTTPRTRQPVQHPRVSSMVYTPGLLCLHPSSLRAHSVCPSYNRRQESNQRRLDVNPIWFKMETLVSSAFSLHKNPFQARRCHWGPVTWGVIRPWCVLKLIAVSLRVTEGTGTCRPGRGGFAATPLCLCPMKWTGLQWRIRSTFNTLNKRIPSLTMFWRWQKDC